MPAEKPHRKDPTIAASLAAQLLGPMPDGGYDPARIEAAISTASELLARASEPRKQHAYELFAGDPHISVKDIAAAFEESEWSKLRSQNTVTERVLELLDLLHAEISNHRALVATAFEAGLPEEFRIDGPASARATIRGLLRSTGMDKAFGAGIDEAVERIWTGMIEIWLQADDDLRAAYAEFRKVSASPATPEFFSAICVEHGYDGYVRSLAPPEGFGIDDILDVALWADSSLGPRLLIECDGAAPGKSAPPALQTLRKINNWLVPFFPETPRFGNPFGKCLVALELYRSSEERTSTAAIERGFAEGLVVFGKAWAALKLRDFVRGLPAGEVLAFLRGMRDTVVQSDAPSIASLSSQCAYDPLEVIDGVWAVMEARVVTRFPTDVPGQGMRCAFPLLRPYAAMLASLGRSLSILDAVVAFFNQPDNLKVVRDAVDKESRDIDALGESLAAEDSEAKTQRIASGGKWAERSRARFTPGQIRPLPLFQYAYRKGWKTDTFSRSADAEG